MSAGSQLALYDAHCHLQDPRLRPYLPEVIRDLERVGVRRTVVNGTQESDWPAVQELAAQHSFIIPAFGLHPWFVKERSTSWLKTLETALAASGGAVGEIGLDRWIRDYDLPDQEEVFVAQLELAAKMNRPVTIHCLRAWGRLLEILSSHALPLPKAGFLLHSYGGPAEMVKQFADLGAYFSVSGYFAEPRKEKQRDVFREVPLERLLIETDAPDMHGPAEVTEFTLPPDGQEELNHPANLCAVYRFAAELRGTPVEHLAEAVESNFARLFAPPA